MSCTATWCMRGEALRTDPGDSCSVGPGSCSACSALQRFFLAYVYKRVWPANLLKQAGQSTLLRAAAAPRNRPRARRSCSNQVRSWQMAFTLDKSAYGQPGGINETYSRALWDLHLRGRRRGRAHAPTACALSTGLALGVTGAKVAPTLIDISPGLIDVSCERRRLARRNQRRARAGARRVRLHVSAARHGAGATLISAGRRRRRPR